MARLRTEWAKFKIFLQKVDRLLGEKYGWKVFRIILLMNMVAVFQFFSAGSLLPLITLVTDPDTVTENQYFGILESIFGKQDVNTWILLFALAMIVFFGLGMLTNAYTIYKRQQFVRYRLIGLAERLLRGYLAQPYPYFFVHNSAVLLKNISTEAYYFTFGVIYNLLLLGTSVFMLIFMGILVLLIDPIVNGIIIILVGAFMGLIYGVLRPIVQRWGKQREAEFAMANQHAHQALTGIKEVKASGYEDVYMNLFMQPMERFARIAVLYQASDTLIGQLIYFVAFIVLITIIVIAIVTQTSVGELLQSLSAYIVVAYVGIFRIVPAFSRGIAYLNRAQYYASSIDVLHESLESAEALLDVTHKPIPFEKEIHIKQMSYAYPEQQGMTLEAIDFHIGAGERVALVGQSGSGKTTLMDIILGLLVPTSGAVEMDGVALSSETFHSWRSKIGYVTQENFVADASFLENITLGYGTDEIEYERLNEIIRTVRLDKLFAELEEGYHTSLGEHGTRFSGGERQRLAIARALYRQPSLMILDEATSALDSVVAREILQEIFAMKDLTILFSSHDLDLIRTCDRVIFLQNGTLSAQGLFDDLVRQHPDFAQLVQASTGSVGTV